MFDFLKDKKSAEQTAPAEYRILVADDRKDELGFLVETLSAYPNPKFKVMAASNGKIACDIAIAQLPDIILLDWEMPIMTGLHALETLRANPATQHIPIIMVTALSYPDDLDYAFEMGATDYITKPYQKLELVARIKNAILKTRLYVEALAKIERLENK